MRVLPVSVALLALFLLPGLGHAQEAGAPILSASRDPEGHLIMNVQAQGGAFDGSVLVTHQDALVGTVVDWMVPLHVDAGATAHLVARGLREDKPLLVRLLAQGDGPSLMPRSRMYVGSTADALPALASVSVPAASGPPTVLADAQRVARDLTGADAYAEARTLVTRDGILVLGWHQGNALHTAWSQDGGHDFSLAQTVSLSGEPGPFDWGMGETSDGDVAFVYHTMANESRAWGMTRLDPVTGSIAYRYQNGLVDVGPRRATVTVLADGGALVTAPRYTSGDTPYGVQVWRLFEEAPVRHLADVVFGDRQVLDTRAAVDGDRIAVAFTTVWQPAPNRAYLATSTDGGASFGAPVELADVNRQGDQGVFVGDIDIDPEGIVHLTASGYEGEVHAGLAVHVRAAPDGTVLSTKRLHGPGAAYNPRLSVLGARVWVAWDEGGHRLAESTDGGRTFGPTHTVAFNGGFVPSQGLATFPDGHPVMPGKRFGDEPTEGWAAAPVYDPRQRASLFLQQSVSEAPPKGLTLDSWYAPPSARAGEEIQVFANYTWQGASSTMLQATLHVDGSPVQAHTHEVGAGMSSSSLFHLTAPAAGDHRIQVALSTGDAFPEVTIQILPAPTPPAPRFVLGDAQAPARVRVGEPVEVRGEVWNAGDAAGAATVRLVVGNVTRDSTRVTVDAQGRATVGLHYTPDREGRHEARFVLDDGQTSAPATTQAYTDTFAGSARLGLSSLQVDAAAAAGSRANASVRVANDGNAEGEANVELVVDGEVVGRDALLLGPSASGMARFSFPAGAPGVRLVTVRLAGEMPLAPVAMDVFAAPSAPTAVSPTKTMPPTPVSPPVRGTRVEVTFLPAELIIPPGGEARLTLVIRNRGTEPVSVKGLDFSGLPPGVAVDLSQTGQPELGAGATWQMPLILTAAWETPEISQATEVDVVDTAGVSAGGSPLTVHVASGDAPQLIPQPGLDATTRVAIVAGSGVGFAGLAGLAYWLRRDAGRWLLGAAALPLYTRMKRGDVLQHPVRAGIHAYIQTHPGVGFEELRKTLGLGNGALVFHLRVLEREGHVKSSKQWTRRTYWTTGTAGVPKGDALASDAITAVLRQEPSSPSAVAQRLGISRQLARYHLLALERQGIVQSEGEGAAQRYRLLRPE